LKTIRGFGRPRASQTVGDAGQKATVVMFAASQDAPNPFLSKIVNLPCPTPAMARDNQGDQHAHQVNADDRDFHLRSPQLAVPPDDWTRSESIDYFIWTVTTNKWL
jgi:hypothetical protein